MNGAASAIESVVTWRGFASLGWLVLLLGWESLAPAWALFRTGGERLRHGFRNVILGAINGLLVAGIFAGLWWMVARWVDAHDWGVVNGLGLSGPWRWAVVLLTLDLWTYFWHRANHRISWLWRFHRVHHSDPQLDVTSANRFHPGELVLSSLLRLPLIAVVGIRFEEVVVYETILQGVVQWQHANVALPRQVERILRWGVVTPGLHHVHHSRHVSETDSNYASVLTVWDWLGGSLQWRTEPAAGRYGLEGFDSPAHQSLPGVLSTPWRGAELNDPSPGGKVSTGPP